MTSERPAADPPIIDSHVHVGISKYRPVEELVVEMERNFIDKAVLVQFAENSDNSYLVDCLNRYPTRFAAVGIVDVSAKGAAKELRQWVTKGIGGLRLAGNSRSPGKEPYAIWATMEELGVVASVEGTLAEMTAPELEDVIARFPGLKIRLEHLGSPDVTEPAPYEAYQKLLRLASYQNVYLAFSAFYWFSREEYPYRDVLPFARLAYEAFGAKRIVWASDWPLVEEYEGYARTLRLANDLIDFDSPDDQAWILGKTASHLWRFI
jgi:predicted TIM-barrel fold metal-dependent hydrolase